MKTERGRLKAALLERVTDVCKGRLHFEKEMKIQGLLGITLDDEEIVLVMLDSVIPTSRSESRQEQHSVQVDTSQTPPLSLLTQLDCADIRHLSELGISNFPQQLLSHELRNETTTSTVLRSSASLSENVSLVLNDFNSDTNSDIKPMFEISNVTSLQFPKVNNCVDVSALSASNSDDDCILVDSPDENRSQSGAISVQSLTGNPNKGKKTFSQLKARTLPKRSATKLDASSSATVPTMQNDSAECASSSSLKETPRKKQGRRFDSKDVADRNMEIHVEQDDASNVASPLVASHSQSEDGGSLSSAPSTSLAGASGRRMPFSSESMKAVECDICGKKFPWRSALELHRHVHTGMKPYPCKLCDKSFRTPAYLQRHLLVHSEERPYSCDICAKAFRSQTMLQVHQRTHTGERPHVCPTCGKTFTHPSSLYMHKRIHSLIRPYTCKLCNKSFIAGGALRTHLRTHTRVGGRSAVRGSKSQKRRRQQLAASVQEHVCTVCGKKFVRRAKLQLHMKSHTSDITCNVCGKKFAFMSLLLSHRSIHTGEKPYQCEICSKKFRTQTNLINHRRCHSDERPFKCPDCGKAFRQASTLYGHRRVHTGEKPHVCAECGKAFAWPHALATHVKKHAEGQRTDLACHICGKEFRRESTLNAHVLAHAGVNPHTCPHCHRQFRSAVSLQEHARTHTGERPFACHLCDERFARKAMLHVHIVAHMNADSGHSMPSRGRRPTRPVVSSSASKDAAAYGRQRSAAGDASPSSDMNFFALASSYVNTPLQVGDDMSIGALQQVVVCELCFASFGSRGELAKHRSVVHNVILDS